MPCWARSGHGTDDVQSMRAAAAAHLTIERLTRDNPAAATLAEIIAFLAPEPVPLAFFTAAADQLQEPLVPAAADTLTWRKLVTALGAVP